MFVVCAEIEEEISQLDDDEKAMFLEELGLKESGLEKLIRASYHLLGLISYLTAGEPEVRAWTIKRGTKAPQAAGKIHTDFERGFIRAEVVSYDDLMACGTHAAAKEKGLVRKEKNMLCRTAILCCLDSTYKNMQRWIRTAWNRADTLLCRSVSVFYLHERPAFV